VGSAIRRVHHHCTANRQALSSVIAPRTVVFCHAKRPPRPGAQQSRPTSKGLAFITMEEEDRLTSAIVKPDVCGRYYKVLRNCFLLIVEGTIQKQGEILNVLAEGAVAM